MEDYILRNCSYVDIIGNTPIQFLPEAMSSTNASRAMTDDIDEEFKWEAGERGHVIRYTVSAVLNGESALRLVRNDAVTPAKLLRAVALKLRTWRNFDFGAVAEEAGERFNVLKYLPNGTKEYVEGDAGVADMINYMHGLCVHREVVLDAANELQESTERYAGQAAAGLKARTIDSKLATILLAYNGETLEGLKNRFADCNDRLKGRMWQLIKKHAALRRLPVVEFKVVFHDTETNLKLAEEAGVSPWEMVSVSEAVNIDLFDTGYKHGHCNVAPGGITRLKPWFRLSALRNTKAWLVRATNQGVTLTEAKLKVDRLMAQDVVGDDHIAMGWLETIVTDAAEADTYAGIICKTGLHGSNYLLRFSGSLQPASMGGVTFGMLRGWLCVRDKSVNRMIRRITAVADAPDAPPSPLGQALLQALAAALISRNNTCGENNPSFKGKENRIRRAKTITAVADAPDAPPSPLGQALLQALAAALIRRNNTSGENNSSFKAKASRIRRAKTITAVADAPDAPPSPLGQTLLRALAAALIRRNNTSGKTITAVADDPDAPPSPRPSVGMKRKRGNQWTGEEDNQLRKLVDEHGDRKWSFIASKMNGRRNDKQCRGRWVNHLKPDIRRGEWTQAEDRILVEGHRMLGTRWAALAKLLPGRPENAIKNHWNDSLRYKVKGQRGGKISELHAYQQSLKLT